MAKKKRFFTKKRVIILSVLVVIVGFIVIQTVRVQAQVREALNNQLVQVAQADFGEIRSLTNTSGLITSNGAYTYFAPVGTKIKAIYPEIGDFVAQGEKLIEFDYDDLQTAYESARYTYNASYYGQQDTIVANDKRYSDIYGLYDDIDELEDDIDDIEDEIASLQKKLQTATPSNLAEKIQAQIESLTKSLTTKKTELAQAETKVDTTEAALLSNEKKKQLDAQGSSAYLTLKTARDNLDKGKSGIVSFADGVVTAVNVTQGASVQNGTAMITVQSKTDVHVLVTLSRYDLEKVEIGHKAVVTFVGREYEGEVTKIEEAAITPSAGAAPVVRAHVQILNPDDRIKLGLEANAAIITAERNNVITIPAACVNTDTQGKFCYIVKDGVVQKVYVTTGASSDMSVEVTSGITQGDLVVVSLPSTVTEGMTVQTTFDTVSNSSGTAMFGMGMGMGG